MRDEAWRAWIPLGMMTLFAAFFLALAGSRPLPPTARVSLLVWAALAVATWRLRHQPGSSLAPREGAALGGTTGPEGRAGA